MVEILSARMMVLQKKLRRSRSRRLFRLQCWQKNNQMSVNWIFFYSNLLSRYVLLFVSFSWATLEDDLFYRFAETFTPPLRTWGHPHPLSCLINLVNFRRLRADSYLPWPLAEQGVCMRRHSCLTFVSFSTKYLLWKFCAVGKVDMDLQIEC